jgi:phage gp36-like protein
MAYCNQADIERKLSVSGVVAFGDDDEDGVIETGVVDDCIEQADGEIDLYARGRYSEAGLASSDLVNRWSTILATCYLCERRGNPVPDSLAKEATRILETLLPKVQDGTLTLPGVAFGNDNRPSFSNLTIDRRYVRGKQRVIQTTSSSQIRELPVNYADQPIPHG